MAAKFRLIWDNRFFDAATLTASSAASGFPAVNLQDKLRKRTWRTTGKTLETLTIDMGENVACSCLALINHNLTCAGLIAVEASHDHDFNTTVLDQEAGACHEIIGYGEGGYGMLGYGGAIPETLRSYYDPEPVLVVYLAEVVEARYWRLTFVDLTNAAAYIEVGRIFLCLHEEFLRLMSYGGNYGGLDESQMTRSLGGQLWIDQMPLVRIMNLVWHAFRREDLNWPMLFFIRQVGLTKYFVVDPLPDGAPSDRYVCKLYCRLAEIPQVQYTDSKYREISLSFEEVM